MSAWLFIRSGVLGAGLAMDAFSVSLANGLREPEMPVVRMSWIAGVYGFFQCIMPLIGWFCISTIARAFGIFEKLVPWIALLLLLYIGGGMLIGGIRENRGAATPKSTEAPAGAAGSGLTVPTILLQGVATSIDALSVGFAFAGYSWRTALLCAIIIAVVTFAICMGGLAIGKRIGTVISGKAEILGGLILIFIGVEIFVRGVFFG